MAHEGLPVTLTKEVAALWIAQLAEADEFEDFAERTIVGKIFVLMDMSIEEGLTEITHERGKVAAIILAAQAQLVDRCQAHTDSSLCS